MGWRELQGYQRAMVDRLKGPEADPESWNGADEDWWEHQRKEREKRRGR